MKYIFLILVVGLGLLLLNHDKGTVFGLNNEDFGRLVYLTPLAALLSVGILAGHRIGLSTALKQMAAWLLIILLLVAGYSYRDNFANIGNHILGNLIPGRASTITHADGSQEVRITRSRDGHFATRVTVNGTPLNMMVDTGASSIVLTYEDARRIGIDVTTLNFIATVRTANGVTTTAPIRLDTVGIDTITRNNLRALVAQNGAMDVSLLGMTFLSTLKSMQMQTDQLILKD